MDLTALLPLFSGTGFVDFIQGPLVWFSFIIFGAGMIVQTILLLKMTRKKDRPGLTSPAAVMREPKVSKRDRFLKRLAFLRLTILGSASGVVAVSFVFHACLVITPVFLLAHNILLDASFGFSFGSFSEKTSDIMTMLVLACGLFFLLRRIVIRRVRVISTAADYILLFVAMAPFLTGFLARHQLFNYNTMIILHILSGELLLVMAPFSKFFHMIFFFISRFMIISEHSLGSPKRSWQF